MNLDQLICLECVIIFALITSVMILDFDNIMSQYNQLVDDLRMFGVI